MQERAGTIQDFAHFCMKRPLTRLVSDRSAERSQHVFKHFLEFSYPLKLGIVVFFTGCVKHADLVA